MGEDVPLSPLCKRIAGDDIAILDGYHQIMKVSVADAKNKLPELIKVVEDGETVTILN